jgi:pilus assembly protein Flp/PilA
MAIAFPPRQFLAQRFFLPTKRFMEKRAHIDPLPGVVLRKGIFVSRLYQSMVRFLKAEDGPTAVEYAVMLALIIVVCIGAITTLGQNANGTFSNVALNGVFTGS